MTWFEVIVLALVQGITEFLPVSSSGHLVLVRDVFGIEYADLLALDVVLHLGTLLAVMMYFSQELWLLLQTFLRMLGRLPVNDRDRLLFIGLLIGTVPAGLVGFFIEDIIGTVFSSSLSVAGGFVIGGFLFIYAEWKYLNTPRTATLSNKHALIIGLWQALALLPGVSRSGATIAGAMLLGFSRVEAARFSFLLAIPIILGAGLKKSIDLLASTEPIQLSFLVIGAGIACGSALIVIHVFLRFISKQTFWPFIWYSFGLAACIAYVHFVS